MTVSWKSNLILMIQTPVDTEVLTEVLLRNWPLIDLSLVDSHTNHNHNITTISFFNSSQCSIGPLSDWRQWKCLVDSCSPARWLSAGQWLSQSCNNNRLRAWISWMSMSVICQFVVRTFCLCKEWMNQSVGRSMSFFSCGTGTLLLVFVIDWWIIELIHSFIDWLNLNRSQVLADQSDSWFWFWFRLID